MSFLGAAPRSRQPPQQIFAGLYHTYILLLTGTMNVKQSLYWTCACLIGLAALLSQPFARLVFPQEQRASVSQKASLQRMPERIVSTNLCTDLLLLSLVPVERIAALNAVSRPAVEELFPELVGSIPFRRISGDYLVVIKPDLVITSPWTNPSLLNIARHIGAETITIPSANSFTQIEKITLQLGNAVGEPQKAEKLVKKMNFTLAQAARAPVSPKARVIAWNNGDTTPGRDSLTDAIITAAGGENLGRNFKIFTQSTINIEELLQHHPHVILHEANRQGASERSRANGHPALAKLSSAKQVTYNPTLHACGLPQSAQEVASLAREIANMKN